MIAAMHSRTPEPPFFSSQKVRSMTDARPPEGSFTHLVGRSRALRHVLEQVSLVAPTDATVLVLGETGTGKELVARAIHERSARRAKAFVTLNCAAIPAALLESELFGYERGAFTGAIGSRAGRFELANGGTLFLDEVGDMPLEIQAKLLRVLQQQQFERLGATRTTTVDVRIVAATNRDLDAMMRASAFRQDLYYRLNVFPIAVPPLRERPDDVEPLARHFLGRFGRRMQRHVDTITDDTLDALRRYDWPGNVRELENLIERAMILSTGTSLAVPLDALAARPGCCDDSTSLAATQRAHVVRVLAETNWQIGGRAGAAARLGLKRTTLQSIMQRLAITRPVPSMEQQRR